MAIMIPDHIDQSDPRRNGERMVFNWLSDSSIPGTVYYSLHQKNHKYKLISEVDFLYVGTRGMLCIEVKGGQSIYRRDRTWYSVNQKGIENEINNPFEQAMGCQYALKNYLAEIYGKHSEQAGYLVGYAVMFPECIFTGNGNDLVTEVVFDNKDNLSDLKSYLNKVFDYWEQQEITKHNHYPTNLTEPQIKQMNDLLRGDFKVVPSFKLQMQYAEQRMIELTEEQYDILDDVEDNNRTIIQGAAGTGKSILALELARKTAAKGKKVLYVCYNNNMAAYANMSVDNDNVTISTFHGLIGTYISVKDTYNYSVQQISQVFMKQTSRKICVFDYLIIDEGQDLICTESIDVLNEFVLCGLTKGKWTIFLDPNQNIFNQSEDFNLAFDYIKENYHATIHTLKKNCRNTEQIARRTSILTLTPPAKYLKVSGPTVVTRAYEDKDAFLKTFKQELMSLIASGVSANDIVILSTRKKENSILDGVDNVCNYKLLERSNIKDFCTTCLNYYTVQSFKGLESKVVLYIDIDGFDSLRNRMLNYVAMSRAMLRLYIFYDASKRNEYEDVKDRGMELLL